MKLSADRMTRPPKKSARGETPWDIARLFPPQGQWTEEEYLALDNSGTGRLIELVDGFLEVLPMPDTLRAHAYLRTEGCRSTRTGASWHPTLN